MIEYNAINPRNITRNLWNDDGTAATRLATSESIRKISDPRRSRGAAVKEFFQCLIGRLNRYSKGTADQRRKRRRARTHAGLSAERNDLLRGFLALSRAPRSSRVFPAFSTAGGANFRRGIARISDADSHQWSRGAHGMREIVWLSVCRFILRPSDVSRRTAAPRAARRRPQYAINNYGPGPVPRFDGNVRLFEEVFSSSRFSVEIRRASLLLAQVSS